MKIIKKILWITPYVISFLLGFILINYFDLSINNPINQLSKTIFTFAIINTLVPVLLLTILIKNFKTNKRLIIKHLTMPFLVSFLVIGLYTWILTSSQHFQEIYFSLFVLQTLLIIKLIINAVFKK